MPRLWVVAGPNGAGKTSLVTRRFSARLPVINPDAIAVSMAAVNGRLGQRRAGERALKNRQALLAARADFAVETTLTGNGILRFIAEARAAGYEIRLDFIGLATALLAIRRVEDRALAGGHAVPLDAILRRYRQSLAQLPRAIRIAHRSRIFDNSEARRRLVAVFSGEAPRWQATDLPAWAREALGPLLANSAQPSATGSENR